MKQTLQIIAKVQSHGDTKISLPIVLETLGKSFPIENTMVDTDHDMHGSPICKVDAEKSIIP